MRSGESEERGGLGADVSLTTTTTDKSESRQPPDARAEMGQRANAVQRVTGCDIRGKKVLVVGAGGIGCELIKNLVRGALFECDPLSSRAP